MTAKSKNEGPLFGRMLREARWLLGYSLRFWKVILLYIVLGIVGTAMGLGASIASKQLIESVTGIQASSAIAAAVGMVVLQLSSIGLRAVSGRIGARVSLRVTNEIQSYVYDRLLQARWEDFSDYRSGDIINRLNGDASTAAGTIIGFFPNLITALCQFFGSLGIILYHDPAMALIALLGAPVSVVFSRLLVKRMRTYNEKMRAASSEVMSFHSDSLQNMQTIKSLGLGSLFSHRFKGVQEDYRAVALDYNKFSVLTSSLMSVMGVIVSISTFGWGAYRLWTNAITFGTLTLFLQLANTLSASFSSLVGLVPTLISSTTAAGRLLTVIDLPQEENDADPLTNENNLAVELRDVSFSYRQGGPVVTHASLQAQPGEIIALIGPSGEGKTTLIRLLLGLIQPKEGEALLKNDQESRPLSAATRRYFSYVPQGNSCFSGTIAENLRIISPNATEDELWDALKAAEAADFVRNLPQGLHTPLGEKGTGLSEGQAQRIAIARALLRNAPILLLDEATSALDAETEQNVVRHLARSCRNRVCILATHRPAILSMCTRIYRMEDTGLQSVSLQDALGSSPKE
ncbi:MAG: ABC transporter ATP-binding protein [Clostridia bacterium]|nr:ABC transporter ATP-binding protein [Clostridia bacterium]